MIFCQSCKTANTVDREICSKCNTKLMLTIAHRSLAPEGAAGSAMEEHLLERISMLEYALARTQERFERVLELMHRQAASNFYDHARVEALIELLGDNQLVNKERLDTAWQARLAEQQVEQQSPVRETAEAPSKKIFASPRVPRRRTSGDARAARQMRSARMKRPD